MAWTVTFYSRRLEEELLTLPAGFVARFLHQFVKKTDKTPAKELATARRRMKEVTDG